ncbi:hypothetical protein [Sandarakinorhabdus sp.]|uniref:hypothetical protein n=1 Tax=Sandarakinorhabdus sp. TaxID=1916663 RepID=UPI00286E81BB|nr:hypothetical protein [Sandarakinorhabdus sp.]
MTLPWRAVANASAAAASALDDAFKVAIPGSGPHMVRAGLEFTMHRLAGAERQLDAIDRYVAPPDCGERAEIAAMRGDIAFYGGQYSQALAHYDHADALVPNAASGMAGQAQARLASTT